MATWKQAADFVFVQVGYSVEAFLRWREANPTDLPVYAGVMVLASAGMATRLRASIPDIDIPDELVHRVSDDPAAGVDAACEQIRALRDTGAFAGCISSRSAGSVRWPPVWSASDRDLGRPQVSPAGRA